MVVRDSQSVPTHQGGSQRNSSGTLHLRSSCSSVIKRPALWNYVVVFLPSDGSHVKRTDGFIPVPSVNLLAVSKDMQTNFIHQKQKISLSGKICFFFPLEKCKYERQNMQQFMGKLCIPLQCVTCSQRGGLDQFVDFWEGKLDLEIFWNILFPLLLLLNTQLQKSQKTLNKSMSWLYFFSHWYPAMMNADLECQTQPTDACKVGSQKAEQERWTQQKVYVSIKYRPYIKPQENWAGFCCTFCFGLGYASIAQRAVPISHPSSWNRGVFREIGIT